MTADRHQDRSTGRARPPYLGQCSGYAGRAIDVDVDCVAGQICGGLFYRVTEEYRFPGDLRYRYVRHPFYLAVFIAVIGGSIVTANWYLFLTSLLPCAFLVARTRIEEEKLVERFGDEYKGYMAKTGRFWPHLDR